MLNKDTFKEMFLLMSEIYEKKFSDGVIKLYYEIVKDMQDEQFEKSIKEILSNRVFNNFPKPAEFREIVFGNKKEVDTQRTHEALAKFKKAYKMACSFTVDDPYIIKTIKLMGGWNDILSRDQKQIPWMEKEFEEKYIELITKKTELGLDIDKFLYTKNDLRQLEKGLEILEPAKIGDEVKIKKWHNLLDNKKKEMLENK